MKRTKWIGILAVIAVLVILDIASRWYVRTNAQPGQVLMTAGRFLRIVFTPNDTGFSWWVPQLPAWAGTFYWILLFCVLLAAFHFYHFTCLTRRQTCLSDIAFIFLTASILGHLNAEIDIPYTTDFIQFLDLPIANLADIYSTVGIAVLVVVFIRKYLMLQPSERSPKGMYQSVLMTRNEFIGYIKNGFRL